MSRRPLRKLVSAALGTVGVAALAFGGFVVWVFTTEHRPADLEPAEHRCDASAPVLKAGVPFSLLTWNLQYGAGRKHRFFYDGGDAVHVPQADVKDAVDGISAALAAAGAELNLLQEIDRDSTRTGNRDQLPQYAAATGARCTAAAAYHRAAFVPKPFTNPLGRVHMALGLLTRVQTRNATRHQLALMNEARVVQALNLKRALLTAEVPVEGHSQPLAIGVTHLSAFSFGDGTLEKQVAYLAEWMAARPPDQPWILAGDFNLLPPGDDKSRLTTEADLYADEANPIEALLPAQRTLLADQLDPSNRTYLPFGHAEPDRKIDYVFVGGPIEVLEGRVMREHSTLSDHLPIWGRLVIGSAAPETEPAAAPPTDPADEPATGTTPEGP